MNAPGSQLKNFNALIAFRKGMLDLKTAMDSKQFSMTERESSQVADLINSIEAELKRRAESIKTLKRQADSEQMRIQEAIECRNKVSQDFSDILHSEVCNTLSATLLETLQGLQEEMSHWGAIKTLSTSGATVAESKPASAAEIV